MRKFLKKFKNSFSFRKKGSAPIPIPKLDLGFNSQNSLIAPSKFCMFHFCIIENLIAEFPFGCALYGKSSLIMPASPYKGNCNLPSPPAPVNPMYEIYRVHLV